MLDRSLGRLLGRSLDNSSRWLVALAGVVVSSGVWAQACQPRVPAGSLVKAGTLVMSTNPTLPPMQFVNQQGEL